jgi:hypothetical protein
MMTWFLYCILSWTITSETALPSNGTITCLIPKDADLLHAVDNVAEYYRDAFVAGVRLDICHELAGPPDCIVDGQCKALSATEGLRKLSQLGNDYLEPPHCVSIQSVAP